MSKNKVTQKVYYLIGIGGAGMSALARLLVAKGYTVYGSDVKFSAVIAELRALKINIFIGHKTEHIAELPIVDMVVISKTAIPANNPELVYAKKKKIPISNRVDALTEIMSGTKQVLVAGSHGKTSTTSMIVVGLKNNGKDPSYAVGGEIAQIATSAGLGKDDLFVAEVDESDGSILQYLPNLLVIPNIEPDHLSFYGTESAYYKVFEDFCKKLPPRSALIVNIADKGVQKLLTEVKDFLLDKEIIVLGVSLSDKFQQVPGYIVDLLQEVLLYRFIRSKLDEAEVIRITNLKDASKKSVKDLIKKNSLPIQKLSLGIYGYHMLSNAVLAVQTLVGLGVDYENAIASMAEFRGVARRSELKGVVNKIAVFDDYAHHPSEIVAVLKSMYELAVVKKGRLIVWFQPHLYSRTKNFVAEFASSLSLADVVYISDIYGAREQPIPGVSAEDIVSLLNNKTKEYIPTPEKVVTELVAKSRKNDVILLVGAGDIVLYADELLKDLEIKYR